VAKSKKASDESCLMEPKWPDDLASLRDSSLTDSVDESIKLLSQNRLSFLFGAGCSVCAGLPTMENLTSSVLEKLNERNPAYKIILDGAVKNFLEASRVTIEDYMSELVDYISIAERRRALGVKDSSYDIEGTSYSADDLNNTLLEIKNIIQEILSKQDVDIAHHRQFVNAIHGRLQLGKAGPTNVVDYFSLNYDTLLEDALSLERIPTADGFDGGVTGWWHVESYDKEPARARLFKIHGSIDWCLFDDETLPRRIRPFLKCERSSLQPILIWPASTKYRETQKDPYAQIIDIMRHTLRPVQNKEVVLSIIGYSFGDIHINEEIDRALHSSEGRLAIVVFTYDSEPEGILRKWFKDPLVRDQVRIHARHGFFHADTEIKTVDELPWWRFEIIARLIGGER